MSPSVDALPNSQALSVLGAGEQVGYSPRDGEEGDVWLPGRGVGKIPEDWDFLPAGDACITRRVKKGPHIELCGRYNRRGRYTPTLGVFAPRAAIEAARAAAKATEAGRLDRRKSAARRRVKAESAYQHDFERACLRFLDFAPEHHELAEQIAAETTRHACEKYSGRVGRTSKLDLQSKAELAVRAHIRHQYTDYHSRLLVWKNPIDDDYREAKANANEKVDNFLEQHRNEPVPRPA